ncbi:Asp23/Gls24 family envelope stress response protein [Paenibacillus terrae]|uniref:Alkaline shock protein 23 n=1 Tax=Paenibacillus terrae TaxID=159743 RepID=A0A0D7X3J2_9BACL|nr:Asp23/Gls24 family envelope stress response protein [Paenibacillus terrae]KJD45789.1 membrane protein [Paenibacillus terrae]
MTENEQHGHILISDDVVSKITGLAALKTPGISAIYGGISKEAIKRLNRKNFKKGISVTVSPDETIIDLRVVVDYGCSIHEVARELQKNVMEDITNMTGLSSIVVNVKVEGVARIQNP